MNWSLSLAIAAVLMAGGVTRAHPPGENGQHDDHHHVDPAKVRAWTNVKTGEVVRGAFLAAREIDGVVRVSLEREGGDAVVFPLADMTEADRSEAQRRIDETKATNGRLAARAASQQGRAAVPSVADDVPAQARVFNVFAPFVTTRWDDRWLHVESDGLPHAPLSHGAKAEGAKGMFTFSHPMMIGITAWQQQVPMPQNYRGVNTWHIPLKPQVADKPVSAKEHLFRGAIALAANGVPIFNPIKNDGKTDTFLAGELDEFGGHCGRADDYHYHIAPTHLQKFVGTGQPIAYALDGFPIHGLFDPTARPGDAHADRCCPLGSTEPLDWMNGHFASAPAGSSSGTVEGKGLYHYHASVKYPYLNGGLRGVVTVMDDQIAPQPRASSPRAALPPLRGARITGFKAMGKSDEPAWSLEYTLGSKKHYVNYRMENGKWVFDFVDPTGAKKTDTYDATTPQRRRGGGDERGEEDRPRRDQAPQPVAPPSQGDAAPKHTPEPVPKMTATVFALSSADVADGRLSIECTCDGKSRSPALWWSAPPDGTKAFAVVMHHLARDGDTHVYMVVANIPVGERELKGGEIKIGTWGQNTVNRRREYAPPCSQGPGDKMYAITLYALSAEAVLPRDSSPSSRTSLTRDILLAAIKDTTLATATLEVKYARAGGGGGPRKGEGAVSSPAR